MNLGSSPQVRGTCKRRLGANYAAGIIPAGAGHLDSKLVQADKSGDHPRRCGALGNQLGNQGRNLGSSPQVRGTYSMSWDIDPKYPPL